MAAEYRQVEFGIWRCFLQVIAILDRLKDGKNNSEGQSKDQLESPNLSEGDEDWNRDDTDEGVIYIK